MEKCVFIGYPAGYKRWKFYNPTTRKLVISEGADFDERYYPGLKGAHSSSPPLSLSLIPCFEKQHTGKNLAASVWETMTLYDLIGRVSILFISR